MDCDFETLITEEGVMQARDPNGQISLMLCESILHLLVEEGAISKEKVIEALNGVAELVREKEETGEHPAASSPAIGLIEAMAQTFALKE